MFFYFIVLDPEKVCKMVPRLITSACECLVKDFKNNSNFSRCNRRELQEIL